MKAFQGFTKFHAKLDAEIMLNFEIHCRQKETQSQESNRVRTMCVYSMVSHGSMMQQPYGSV
jgi:hypothetical protein